MEVFIITAYSGITKLNNYMYMYIAFDHRLIIFLLILV